MILETIPQIIQLSRAEQIELAQELWEHIATAAGPDDFPLTPEQEVELERRLRKHRANPGQGVPYEEAIAKLLSKYQTGDSKE